LIWDKKQNDRFTSGQAELAWSSIDQPIRTFRMSQVEAYCGAEGKDHPTQKPSGLMRWCVAQAGNPNTVLDPYMGAGSTGVACMQLGRKFIGIEIERKYFDIACERIENAQRQVRMFV
jgi:site-specific DNA-methyltransferase (adenine-specific)/modification methylase